MERKDLVAQAVRLALAAGMAGVASVSPATAQENLAVQDDVAVQEKITVTGSRIKRADYEGPLPVTVITREDIDASGEISIGELLRTQTFNTFGSAKPQPGNGVTFSAVSLRGLGEEYTLVLLNGRRMASAPRLGATTQNLSVIPLAAVERIEVLRDGASAIYGTDAMAGVINIILRQDYSGMHLSYGIGRPTQSGGDEDSYSITGGVSGPKGNVTFGMDVQQKEIVFNRERAFTSQGMSMLGFPSSYFAYLYTDDPRNPTGQFLSIGTTPDPRCPAEIGSDPDFPWSTVGIGFWGGPQCRYAYWGESAKEADTDTKSSFVDTNYQLSDRAQFFARGVFSYNEVFGRYAPSPARLVMSADAPQNPTNPQHPTNYRGDPFELQAVDVDTDGDGVPDTTVDGPFDLSVDYRNIPGGNRDMDAEDTLLDYVAGLRGSTDWLGGADWELAAQWSQLRNEGTMSGQVLVPFLQDEIDSGAFDIYGVFGPYGQDEIDAAGRATATGVSGAKHRITGGDGQISFDAFQLEHGPVPVALGFEYRDEDYESHLDEQWAAGNFGGSSAQSADYSGARVVKSLFAEGLIPVMSRLELNVAGRYDDYNDFGTTVNPKISVAFRPLDTLLIRASYGNGFRAPGMDMLYAPSFATGTSVIDSWRCSQTPEGGDDGRPIVDPETLPLSHPCRSGDSWYGGTFVSNPDLDPETSDNWTAGFVWSPTADVSVLLDYYDIEIDDRIESEDVQPLFDEEMRLRQAGEEGASVGRVTRNRRGWIEDFIRTYENVEKIDTNGFDVEASYAFSLARAGDFRTTLRWTHVFEFNKDFQNGEGMKDWAGSVGFPQDRGQLAINWNFGDYSATVIGNYVADQHGNSPGDDGEYEEKLASFTTWDVQATYSTPWNGLITLGARNVFDRDPPQYRDGTEYDIQQHEIYGRVPYLRLEQDF
jgi:iron complex outermembrane receptor protein